MLTALTDKLTEVVTERVAERLLGVDPVVCKTAVERLRKSGRYPDAYALARATVNHFARRAALRGFVTGLPSSPWLSVPLAWVDTRTASRLSANVAAAVGYVANARFFDSPGWKRTVLDAIAAVSPDASVSAPRTRRVRTHTRALAMRALLSGPAQRYVRRSTVRWAARRSARRRLALRFVPVVGAVVTGLWSYAEVYAHGMRAIRHFGLGAPTESV